MPTRYAAECTEWQEIAREIAQQDGVAIAFDVSEEQRRRMAARGECPMTYDEILAEVAASAMEA